MESKATRKQIQAAVRQMIDAAFPPDDGWELNLEDKWKEYKIDYVIERKVGSRRFRNLLKVSFRCGPLERNARILNKAARKMAGRYVKIEEKIEEKILVSPKGLSLEDFHPSIRHWTVQHLVCTPEGPFWEQASVK